MPTCVGRHQKEVGGGGYAVEQEVICHVHMFTLPQLNHALSRMLGKAKRAVEKNSRDEEMRCAEESLQLLYGSRDRTDRI